MGAQGGPGAWGPLGEPGGGPRGNPGGAPMGDPGGAPWGTRGGPKITKLRPETPQTMNKKLIFVKVICL